jgi:CheY-like chemotaxis protein
MSRLPNAPVSVLLVEDNPADVVLIRETLKNAGVAVDLASVDNGHAALERLYRGLEGSLALPSLVILDLNIPGLSGKDVLARIRADARLRTFPVIVLTTSSAERDIRESYAGGANAYVTKPLGLDAFEAALRSLETFWFGVAQLPEVKA